MVSYELNYSHIYEVSVLLPHASSPPRSPTRISTDPPMIAIPTLINPIVISISCHLGAFNPAAVIGDMAPVPNIAASVVNAQFA